MSRIAAARRTIQQTQAQLSDLEAQRAAQVRRDDSRRKIVLGAALIGLLATFSEAEKRQLLGRVHEHVTREKDRAFLGLAALARTASQGRADLRPKTRPSVGADGQQRLPGIG